MPIEKTVADLVTPQTFSNKTLDSSCTFESLIQSYELGDLPAAALVGRLAWLTDDVRGLYADIGSQWVAINGGIANVQNYGAVGDGITDATDAVQAAMATGKSVYFPDGTYLIDEILPLSFSGQAFYGNGPGSIIRATNPAVPLW